MFEREVKKKYKVTAETTGGTIMGSITKPISAEAILGCRNQTPSANMAASSVAQKLLTAPIHRLNRKLSLHLGSSRSVQ